MEENLGKCLMYSSFQPILSKNWYSRKQSQANLPTLFTGFKKYKPLSNQRVGTNFRGGSCNNMKDESTYQKQNWDWVFALPFIIMILYLLMG